MRTSSKAQLIPFFEGALYTVSLKSFHNLTTSPVARRLRPRFAKGMFFPPLRSDATTYPLEVGHTGNGPRALPPTYQTDQMVSGSYLDLALGSALNVL